MFEAKRKGYCFIPYPFTVKVSPKSNQRKAPVSQLVNALVNSGNRKAQGGGGGGTPDFK